MVDRSSLVGILIVMSLIVMLLYIAFGQITVRKLRKIPKAKEALGFEYVSGWDIINVAQALALPRSWTRKLEKTPLSSLYANSEILFANTSKFDQVLGAAFYWLMTVSGLGGVLLAFLNFLGVFD
jgi:hypothetical protein